MALAGNTNAMHPAIHKNQKGLFLCRATLQCVPLRQTNPSMMDLALFWPLLATYGTGQRITVYNSIVLGPKQPGEKDGPEEMYVILLDNGRTNILANPRSRESLYCIRCGACLNACPVYKNIGGHTYGTTYSGPIGAVITPHLREMGEWKHLSYASSLCGNCTEVCAVKINLHELLLENRYESVEKGETNLPEKNRLEAVEARHAQPQMDEHGQP